MLTAEVQTMKKGSAQAEDKPRDTVPVKIDRELHRKLKMLALSKGKELYEYLDGVLRPGVERDYKRLIRD
jgi:hypothetical protein